MMRLTDELETIVRDTLKTTVPGISETIRAAIVRALMLRMAPAILARRDPGELAPLGQVKRLALDCQPDQVPATLAAIARICIDAERALELQERACVFCHRIIVRGDRRFCARCRGRRLNIKQERIPER